MIDKLRDGELVNICISLKARYNCGYFVSLDNLRNKIFETFAKSIADEIIEKLEEFGLHFDNLEKVYD